MRTIFLSCLTFFVTVGAWALPETEKKCDRVLLGSAPAQSNLPTELFDVHTVLVEYLEEMHEIGKSINTVSGNSKLQVSFLGHKHLLESVESQPKIVQRMANIAAEKSIYTDSNGDPSYREYAVWYIRFKKGQEIFVEATSNEPFQVETEALTLAFLKADFPTKEEAIRRGLDYYAVPELGMEMGSSVVEVIALHSHPPVLQKLPSGQIRAVSQFVFSDVDLADNLGWTQELSTEGRSAKYSAYVVPIVHGQSRQNIITRWGGEL